MSPVSGIGRIHKWLALLAIVHAIGSRKIGYFTAITSDLVRKIALQSLRIEKGTRSAGLHVGSSIMTADEKFAVRRINEVTGCVGIGTLNT